ncbi:hypothetical protein, partial [Frankia canadensis]|uniref:hypothetical protein n=1 Tax=Frankia canadensis TaxID=1836972 RepID=UPI001055A974
MDVTPLATALADGLPNRMTRNADLLLPVRDGLDVRLDYLAGGGSISIPALLASWPPTPSDVGERITQLAAALLAALPDPATARDLPALVVRMVTRPAGGMHPRDGWQAAARLTEAGCVLLEKAASDGDLQAGEALPFLRRARYLLLSAPARFSTPTGGPSAWPTDVALGSEVAYAARLEQARLAWALDLVNHDEHTELRQQLHGRALDAELRRLVLVTDHSGAPARTRAELLFPDGIGPTTVGGPSGAGPTP